MSLWLRILVNKMWHLLRSTCSTLLHFQPTSSIPSTSGSMVHGTKRKRQRTCHGGIVLLTMFVNDNHEWIVPLHSKNIFQRTTTTILSEGKALRVKRMHSEKEWREKVCYLDRSFSRSFPPIPGWFSGGVHPLSPEGNHTGGSALAIPNAGDVGAFFPSFERMRPFTV